MFCSTVAHKLRTSKIGFEQGVQRKMEKELGKSHNGINNNHHHRERVGLGIGGGSGDGVSSSSRSHAENRSTTTTSSDFVLQWGNRKRLRCMKIQVKDDSAPVQRTTARVDRRVVRSEKDLPPSQPSTTLTSNGGGYLNLRQRPSTPPPPPPLPQRTLRNSETMRAQQSNGVGGDQKAHDKKGTGTNNYNNGTTTTNNGNLHHNHVGGGSGASSETAHDSKKGGSSSGSDAIPSVWPPKFVIALTNKEKEEDFIAFKGSKLPQRPKKRAKFIQRTLNLVSPGAWLCDLTLERYEVREKKISKKRPRGLKAMGNYMESDSE